MRAAVTMIAGLLVAGCLTPRSMALGQTAAPIGAGATEVGVFTGVQYASQVMPPTTRTDLGGETFTDQTSARGLSLPAAEANVQHGLNERFALNLHLSPAGIQPGLKWTLNRSRIFHFALLPAMAVGFANVSNSTFAAGPDGRQTEIHPGNTTSFTFMSGLKLLFSHRSGFFAGAGYDFLFNRSFAGQTSGANNVLVRTETTTQVLQHQITASVGMDIPIGSLRLRPEVAFSISPATSRGISTRQDTTTTDFSSSGGVAWAIFPGFTLAVATPARAKSDDADGDDDRVKTDDDDDDDEDEAPNRRARRRRGSGDDDEDDERPRRRRSGDDDDNRPTRRTFDDDDDP